MTVFASERLRSNDGNRVDKPLCARVSNTLVLAPSESLSCVPFILASCGEHEVETLFASSSTRLCLG